MRFGLNGKEMEWNMVHDNRLNPSRLPPPQISLLRLHLPPLLLLSWIRLMTRTSLRPLALCMALLLQVP